MSGKKSFLFWLIFGLSLLTILSGILIICVPSLYWSFMNVVLGLLLVLLGIAAMANSIRNWGSKFVGFLMIIGLFAIIFGFMIMFSTEHCVNEGIDDLGETSETCDSGGFLGTLIMWLFAFWALIRGGMLVFFGFQGKGEQKYRLLEIILGIILVFLGFFTMFNTTLGTQIAGICMGISILFDGVVLCLCSFRILSADDAQIELMISASQNEIYHDQIGTQTNVAQNTTQTLDSLNNNQPQVSTDNIGQTDGQMQQTNQDQINPTPTLQVEVQTQTPVDVQQTQSISNDNLPSVDNSQNIQQ